MRYAAIHFDMDGVIADTEPLHVIAEQQTCRDFNFAIDPNEWGGFKGKTAEDIFHHLLYRYGDPKRQTVRQLIDHKTELFLGLAKKELKPIDGVLEFLRWSRDNHGVMNLVTSSNKRVQECITDAFSIGHYFDHIITGDDVTNGKPHPEPYLTSLKRSGARAEHSVIIEDSKSGIQAGLGAGCSVLGIATSHTTRELSEVEPTFIANDYATARRILELV